ncbi:MAG: hypothetical protein GXY44_02410 [Phycisphaerales bacterium]|nr:hypothetical protein [Phycisphaerales bacterium]
MTNDLLQYWLRHYDPIHRGWTPKGIANGLCSTEGFFFPRIAGGYNLFRAVGRVPADCDPIVGAAGHDAVTIRTFPWIRHAASTVYMWRLAAIGGGGVGNCTDEASTTTAFDEAGRWVGCRPNAPADLRVTALSGGRFLLRWTYTEEGQQVEPLIFHIYHDGGRGTMDYETPVGVVDYRRRQWHYAFTTAGFDHDTRVRWAVRAVSASGVEERNVLTVAGRAERQAPPINPPVMLSLVASEGRV